MQKGGQQQKIHQPNVFAVKPKISIALVGPVPVQAQKILPGGGLPEDYAEQLWQCQRPGQHRQQKPWLCRLPKGCTAAARRKKRGAKPYGAQHYQRQKAVGVYKGQAACQQPHSGPKACAALKSEQPQQIQAAQQKRPAKQRGALGKQKIGQGVHPADIFLHIVGGRGVIAVKNAEKILTAAAKIQKAESAAAEKQPKGQRCLAAAAQSSPCQQPKQAVNGKERRELRQKIGGAQRCAEQQKHAAYAFA